MTGETETLRPQETGKVQLPSAVAMYTAKDVDDDMSRAVIYINLLKPHNLSPTEFSQATETLDGMKKADKLKWLNNFSSLRLPQQKAALRTFVEGIINVVVRIQYQNLETPEISKNRRKIFPRD